MKLSNGHFAIVLCFFSFVLRGAAFNPSEHEESMKLINNTSGTFNKNDEIQRYKILSANIAFYNNAIGALNNKSKNSALSKQEEGYITDLKEILKTDDDDLDNLIGQAAERRKINKSCLVKYFGQKTLDTLEKERHSYLQEIKKSLKCDDAGLQQFLDYAKVNEHLQNQSGSSIKTIFVVLSLFFTGGACGYSASRYNFI